MSIYLSVGDRWRIISLNFDQSRSVREIARIVHCNIQTVYNILQLFEETGDVIERTGRGRGAILNDEEIHTLRQIFYRYSNDTSNSIARRFFQRTGIEINPRTIRNYRILLGFHPVHARVQPYLTATHAEQRLNFCLSNSTARWRNTIFSDEKAFVVDITGVVYWIPYGRQRPHHHQHQVQFRVPVFGAVWFYGRSNLVFIQGRTNTITYVEYLQAALRRHLRDLNGYQFVHDRPTWAHSMLAHDWLFNNYITCMGNYPAASPDLNAVESVWAWMNRYIQRHHPNSQRSLERLVRRAWNAIPQTVIQGYINNIRNICNQIIDNNGWESSG